MSACYSRMLLSLVLYNLSGLCAPVCCAPLVLPLSSLMVLYIRPLWLYDHQLDYEEDNVTDRQQGVRVGGEGELLT